MMQSASTKRRERPIWPRSCLVFAYVLSAILATGYHEHEGESHDAPALIADCCLDSGIHLEDHPDAPDLSAHYTSCLACQHRLDDLAFLSKTPDESREVVRIPVDLPVLGVELPSPVRASSRAPPAA